MNIFIHPNIDRLLASRNFNGLINALGHGKGWFVRKAAAEALGRLGDIRAIPPLTAALQDEDKDVRLAAADALDALHWRPDKDEVGAHYWISRKKISRCSEIGAPAVLPLIRVLAEHNQDECVAAAEALGKIGDIRAIPPLIAVLRESGWGFIGNAATEALSRMGSAGTEPLLPLVNDPVTDIRLAAVRALGGIGDPLAVDRLCSALHDSNRDVRQAAAAALGKIGPPAVGSLISALPDRYAAAYAARALGRIGDARAVPALVAALNDTHYEVRAAAVEALVLFSKKAVIPLIAALSDPSKDTRSAAAEALDGIGWQPPANSTGTEYWIAMQNWDRCTANGEASIKPLMARLKDADPEIRKACVVCLGKIGDRRALVALTAALRDGYPPVRAAAAECLGWLCENCSTTPLLEALEDPDWTVRKAAAASLRRIGDLRAVDPLIRALADKSDRVRETAAEALGRIADIRAVEPLNSGVDRRAAANGQIRRGCPGPDRGSARGRAAHPRPGVGLLRGVRIGAGGAKAYRCPLRKGNHQ